MTLRSGGNLAIAIRKNSPQLAAATQRLPREVRPWHGVRQHHREALSGQHDSYVKDATSEAERKKFLAMVELFRKYGDAVRPGLPADGGAGLPGIAARPERQEPRRRGRRDADDAGDRRELKVGDISKIEPNIHAGVKYMRFMMDRYYKDEPMDRLNKGLFTFASYNAGPARIRQLRQEAAERGLDPNVWFGNVEQIASERIGRETVTYVSNIYKYYIAYQLLSDERARRETAKSAVRSPTR